MKNSKDFWPEILMAVLAALPLGMGLASVENHTESDENYKMSYPIVYVESNQEAQDRINSDIYQYIAGFRGDYGAGKFTRGNFSYQVRYEDGTLISLTLADSRYSQGGCPWIYQYSGSDIQQGDRRKTAAAVFCPDRYGG